MLCCVIVIVSIVYLFCFHYSLLSHRVIHVVRAEVVPWSSGEELLTQYSAAARSLSSVSSLSSAQSTSEPSHAHAPLSDLIAAATAPTTTPALASAATDSGAGSASSATSKM